MSTEIFQYLRNWFEKTKYFGKFIISDGDITFEDGSALPLVTDQYFRIVGSVLNDGAHKFGDSDLEDEEFNGAVWSMAVPPAVASLIAEILEWSEANSEAINSPYQSESFGGYSYSFKSGNSGGTADGATWQSQFAARLSPWRKI